MYLASPCSCLCPIHWSQLLVENEDVVGTAPTGDVPTTSEWSWNFIAYYDASNIRGLTVHFFYLTLAFIFSLMMKFWHAFQSPFFMALEAATKCSLMLSGGPTRGWRSLTRSTWWKFLLIRRRRASNSWASNHHKSSINQSQMNNAYHTWLQIIIKYFHLLIHQFF